MSGRRLRHVNAKMESYGAFLKKRKGGDKEASSSKKTKIWKGMEKMDASDSDDTDGDDSDEELGEQIEKSVVINNEKSSELHEEANGSSGSVIGGKINGESSVGCSSESTSSEQEKDIVVNRRMQSSENFPSGGVLDEEDGVKKAAVEIYEQGMVQERKEPCLEVAVEVEASQNEAEEFTEAKSCGVEKIIESPVVPALVEDVPVVDKPLDFDEYGSAAEMEDLRKWMPLKEHINSMRVGKLI